MQIKKPGGTSPIPIPSPRPIAGPLGYRSPVVQPNVSAPPVYRPNSIATQPKMQAGTSLPSRTSPGAPPVYASRSIPVTAAPPVYRPDANMKSVLAKTAGRSTAPPVYRPSAIPAQKKSVSSPAASRGVNHASQTALGPAPPVYQPAPSGSIKKVISPSRTTMPFSDRGNMNGALQPRAFNRQQSIFFTSQVQNSRIGSSQMPPSLAALRSVSRGTTIQRLVILVSRDDMAAKNYDNLVEIGQGYIDPTNSLRPFNDALKGKPFDQLGQNETLHIVSHGDGQGHIEGQDDKDNPVQMNASEFLTFMIKYGLKPTHKGAIRFISCFSGTPTSSGTTFAEEFKNALRKQGFDNPVIAFDGLVGVKPNAHVGVVPPSQVNEFEKLQEVEAKLSKEYQELLNDKSIPNRMQRLEELLELRKKRTTESNELFKPQNFRGVEPNIVYFPSGSASNI